MPCQRRPGVRDRERAGANISPPGCRVRTRPGCSARRLTGRRHLTSVLTHVDVLALLEYFSSSTTTAITPAVTTLDQAGLKTECKAIFPHFLTNSNLNLRRTPVTLK
jgi:hypothetical protein